MTPLQKLPKNVGDLGKLIVAKGFKRLPKVQKIAQSGHTAGQHRPKDINRRYERKNKQKMIPRARHCRGDDPAAREHVGLLQHVQVAAATFQNDEHDEEDCFGKHFSRNLPTRLK